MDLEKYFKKSIEQNFGEGIGVGQEWSQQVLWLAGRVFSPGSDADNVLLALDNRQGAQLRSVQGRYSIPEWR